VSRWCGSNIQKNKFINFFLVINADRINGIANIAGIFELDCFDQRPLLEQ